MDMYRSGDLILDLLRPTTKLVVLEDVADVTEVDVAAAMAVGLHGAEMREKSDLWP